MHLSNWKLKRSGLQNQLKTGTKHADDSTMFPMKKIQSTAIMLLSSTGDQHLYRFEQQLAVLLSHVRYCPMGLVESIETRDHSVPGDYKNGSRASVDPRITFY
jgi:hypothetical protein